MIVNGFFLLVDIALIYIVVLHSGWDAVASIAIGMLTLWNLIEVYKHLTKDKT